MNKKDLINAIAEAIDKHTKSAYEVQCIIFALDDISEFMTDAGSTRADQATVLDYALRSVYKNIHADDEIEALHKSVFKDIRATTLAKEYNDALQILCHITDDCTDNNEMMAVTDD